MTIYDIPVVDYASAYIIILFFIQIVKIAYILYIFIHRHTVNLVDACNGMNSLNFGALKHHHSSTATV